MKLAKTQARHLAPQLPHQDAPILILLITVLAETHTLLFIPNRSQNQANRSQKPVDRRVAELHLLFQVIRDITLVQSNTALGRDLKSTPPRPKLSSRWHHTSHNLVSRQWGQETF